LEHVIKIFHCRDFWTGFCSVPIQASDGADFLPKKNPAAEEAGFIILVLSVLFFCLGVRVRQYLLCHFES